MGPVQQGTDGVPLNDPQRLGGGHHPPPAPAGVLLQHQVRPLCLERFGPFLAVKGTDGLGGLLKGGVLGVYNHLGHHTGNLAVDMPGLEKVVYRPLKHIAQLSLGLRAAQVDALRGHRTGGRLRLEQDVAHLGAIPMDQNQPVALLI
jgi:hypothetical protein